MCADHRGALCGETARRDLRGGRQVAGVPSLIMNTEQVKSKITEKGYTLHDPLSESQIRAFEVKHEIKLPQDYRDFITKIGCGGDGPPDYNLDPFDIDEDFPNLSKPFPFTTHWIWELGDESNEGGMEDLNSGNICLGTDGCGVDWYIIVSGPQRGKIWMISGEGIQPLFPSRTFSEWYAAWLDGETEWFQQLELA